MRGAHRFTGILGWPLDQTLSPAIHNAAFRSLGMDWIYLEWPVPPEKLAAAVAGLRAFGAEGANVTMPHKEAVLTELDELSGDARRIGAVNTIQRLGDQLIGHNTDVDGFSEFLAADAGVQIKDRSTLVLGAGGAARAVVCALEDLGARRIVVAARNEERALPVTQLARPIADVIPWEGAAATVAEVDLVVNATPLGWRGEKLLEDAPWHPGQVACDLVYAPPVTPFMEGARSKGVETWGGLGMLIHQAAASFRIWTGRDPSIATMSAAAVRSIGSR